MDDRICIRLSDGTETTPTFYGHWCGLRGLKVMLETLKHPAVSPGGIMCNFIVNVMGGEPKDSSYDIWNSEGGESAANGDWWLWTFHTRQDVWTTTHPLYCDRRMTSDELESLIKSKRPCLYRECKCEEYGSSTCAKAFYERLDAGQKKKNVTENNTPEMTE